MIDCPECVFFRSSVPVSRMVCGVAKVPGAKVMKPPPEISALDTACARLPVPLALVFATTRPLAKISLKRAPSWASTVGFWGKL